MLKHSTTRAKQPQRSHSDTKHDAIDLAARFQQEYLNNTPPLHIMRDEIRLNALKIRPFAGDVFQLNLSDKQFITALWGILKLEEFVLLHEKSIKRGESELFYRLMSQYRNTLQESINRVDIRLPHLKKKPQENPIAIEIFREASEGKRKRRVH